jgi:hypothetical protein
MARGERFDSIWITGTSIPPYYHELTGLHVQCWCIQYSVHVLYTCDHSTVCTGDLCNHLMCPCKRSRSCPRGCHCRSRSVAAPLWFGQCEWSAEFYMGLADRLCTAEEKTAVVWCIASKLNKGFGSQPRRRPYAIEGMDCSVWVANKHLSIESRLCSC